MEKYQKFREKFYKVMQKPVAVLKVIFGYGIMLTLFAGGLTFFGYVAALIIGGTTATEICAWIYKTFVPYLIYVTTVLILFGLLVMYLGGEKALIPVRKHSKSEEKKQ